MANQYVNKVVVNGTVKLDISGDTVTADKLLKGVTAHLKSGAPVTGTCEYDSDTTDATASADEILSGETAYAAGQKVTGSMTNNGGISREITTKAQEISIPVGYHDGSGKVKISATEQAKIIAGNIKSGISILGITGSYGGESVTAQAKSVTPSFSAQVVTPDASYDYLSQVTVAAIPVSEADNASGGVTLTIG